ncbi:hypothetical protein N0V86_004451 [Didymella sp. IMI 355093]|nr:hypothetical protein N0V86_004451 [Didymella sp. IMI 355093]
MHDTHEQTRHGSPQQDRSRSGSSAPNPTGRSSNGDAEELSLRASLYFTELYTFDATRESGTAARARSEHFVPSSTGVRTASVVTLFPRGVEYDRVLEEADTVQSEYSIQQDSVVRKESFFKKHYRRLKEIHDDGPPGEAQMFLAGMNNYLKERKATAEFEMCSPRHNDEAKPKPSSESAGQQLGTGQSLGQPPWTRGTLDGHKLRTRKDSVVSYGNISCTSQEVLVKIRRTMLEMDVNKPLPPLPPAVPKHRLRNKEDDLMDINKPLPHTPLDCTGSEKQAREPPVDMPLQPSLSHTVCLVPSAHQLKASQEDIWDRPQYTEQEAQRIWLDDFTDTSKFPLPPSGESKPSKAEKAHDALKAKISHPIPIPCTSNYCPPELTPDASEKHQGKPETPSSPTWLEKLAHPMLPAIPTMPTMPTFYKPKKRPASDESFACQGLRESNVYAEMVMGAGALSVGAQPVVDAQSIVGARSMASAGKSSRKVFGEGLMPAPLFTGRRSDGTFHEGNNEQRRTGRWI